ncbi:MAG: hypothetical protein KJO85_10070 [Gammaproteobacteria bacterium]|nr:hypothetical protein [Gammaproteobacteria bacterium]
MIARLAAEVFTEAATELPALDTHTQDHPSIIEACASVSATEPSSERLKQWLKHYCRQEEAVKKVCRGEQDSPEINMDSYAALSAAFARACEHRIDWRWFNVLLKLNDLLVFHIEDLLAEQARSRLSVALKIESHLVSQVAAQRGIITRTKDDI